MEMSVPHRLSSAVAAMLRPLVRVLLRNGIAFGTFSDLAKRVYVDVAAEEFGIEGRKQSISRISVITGLTRKEVLRVRRLPDPGASESAERYNRAARVIGGWVRDRRFWNDLGAPAVLQFDRGERTFTDLVKAYSGDATPRAVLDELLRVGAVERTENGDIRLIGRAYIPRTDETEKLGILGTDVADLIRTIDHNIQRPLEPFFQRKVSYDNLPAEALPEFRAFASARAQTLLEELDQWLSRQDRDANPAAEGTGRMRAGLSIYYFEEDLAHPRASSPTGEG
jgi:hypothetical protein